MRYWRRISVEIKEQNNEKVQKHSGRMKQENAGSKFSAEWYSNSWWFGEDTAKTEEFLKETHRQERRILTLPLLPQSLNDWKPPSNKH